MLQEAHVDPKSKRDLSPAERAFVAAASEMGFGRFEGIRIRRGELVLVPFPTAIRTLKFASASRESIECAPNSNLKKQSEEFLEFIRGVDEGVMAFGFGCSSVLPLLPSFWMRSQIRLAPALALLNPFPSFTPGRLFQMAVTRSAGQAAANPVSSFWLAKFSTAVVVPAAASSGVANALMLLSTSIV